MALNYRKIEDDISIHGLFSEYLPPCFKMNKTALNNPPSETCDLIPPYCFSMSRFSKDGARRNIFIPEVGAYAVLQSYVKQEKIIQELIAFTQSNNVSFSPIIGDQGTIMFHEQVYHNNSAQMEENSDYYVDNIAKKLIAAEGSTRILRLDIANCYASLYVHMVSATLLGVECAEKEYAKSQQIPKATDINPKYLKYTKLDKLIRQQNLNRTNGVLTGPLFSKIIIESILTQIDKELSDIGLSYSRYVDDYDVYLRNEEPNSVISMFTKVLKRYGFTLNYEKTMIVDFPFYVIENLNKLFCDYSKEKLQTDELMKLFNSFLTLEKAGTAGAIRYLLKSIEKKPITTQNPDLYKAYLLTILANNERSLSKVCSILINDKETLSLSQKDISVVQRMLLEHIKFGHDLEVIWLAYLLVEINSVSEETINSIVDNSNELAQVILFRRERLTEQQINRVSEKAESWILLYELYAGDVITETEFIQRLKLHHNISMYQKLKERNEHFYV